MNLREPAGGKRRRGNSAEFHVRARAWDGPPGNTRGTVRGRGPRGRYPFAAGQCARTQPGDAAPSAFFALF